MDYRVHVFNSRIASAKDHCQRGQQALHADFSDSDTPEWTLDLERIMNASLSLVQARLYVSEAAVAALYIEPMEDWNG